MDPNAASAPPPLPAAGPTDRKRSRHRLNAERAAEMLGMWRESGFSPEAFSASMGIRTKRHRSRDPHRQTRRDPAELAPILARLELDVDRWLACMLGWRQFLGAAVGRLAAPAAEAACRGLQWVQKRCLLFAAERVA